MNVDWSKTPELNNINPAKLNMLNALVSEAEHKNPNELLPFFMASMKKAEGEGIGFDDKETELILNIMKTKMSSADIKKIDTIRNLSKMIAARTKK